MLIQNNVIERYAVEFLRTNQARRNIFMTESRVTLCYMHFHKDIPPGYATTQYIFLLKDPQDFLSDLTQKSLNDRPV